MSYFPDPDRQPRVRVPGFEPGTSALSELRSSQLSYTRDADPAKHKSQTDWGLALSADLDSPESYPPEGGVIIVMVRIRVEIMRPSDLRGQGCTLGL